MYVNRVVRIIKNIVKAESLLLQKEKFIMDEKYVCQLCMQTLEDPRLLDCLHIFCAKCLVARSLHYVKKTLSQDEGISSLGSSSNVTETIVADNINDANEPTRITHQMIQCSTCGNETILKRGGVSSLPLHLKLQNEIINIKNKLPPCDLCSSSACAFTRCYECDIMMCGLCTDSHKEFRDTALHTLVQLRTNRGRSSNSKIQQTVCINHANQEANFFCWYCSELICYTCCTSQHAGHKMDTIAQSAIKVIDSIKDELNNVKPLVKQIALNADAVKYKIHKVKTRCSDVEKEIDLFMQSYKEALENHWQTLKNDVEAIKQNRLEVVQKMYDTLEEKLKKGQTMIDLAEDLIQDSSPAEALSISKPLLNRLEVYTEADINTDSKMSECLKFLPDEKLIFKKYQLLGIISTQSISLDHCTLQTDGLLSCRQHKMSSFILTTRDNDNQPLSHGGEKIVAELRYKDAVQRVVPVYVKDEGNGTYTLSFTPNISGNMLLTVFIQNKHIKGSPYKVFVSSLRPHKGTFHCCAFCSSGGNKTTNCGCNSKMPGGYNGCGHGHAGHPGRRHWSCCGNVLQNSECNQPVPYHCT